MDGMVYDTVVVGAGITGLAAAYELHRRGTDVLVLEREDRVGGCIRSERTDDGFVLEHGPHTVRTADPELFDRALREHAALLDARGEPGFVRVVQWQRAIPQWNVGELDARAACDRIEARRPGLVLAGGYRGGVSVPDCWSNGRRAATRIGAPATASRSR